MEALRRLFTGMSKPTLVSILALVTAFAVERAWAWRQGVDAHIRNSASADARLSSLERGQERLGERLERMEEAQRQRDIELQRQILEQFRWLAEHQFGDKSNARELDKRLRELKDE